MPKGTTVGGSKSSKIDPKTQAIKVPKITQAKKVEIASTLGLYYIKAGSNVFQPTAKQRALMRELFLLAARAAGKKLPEFYKEKIYVCDDDFNN